jgi:hypothetical protein
MNKGEEAQVFTEVDVILLLDRLDPIGERWMNSESSTGGYDVDTSLLVDMMNEVARIVRLEKLHE